MTDYNTISEVFVPENMDWGALIRCTECGEGGPMYSTHEPHPEMQWWDCDNCDDYTKHEILMKTDSVEEMRDAAGNGEGPDTEGPR